MCYTVSVKRKTSPEGKDITVNNSDRKTRIAYILEAGFEYFISLFVTSTFLGYILDAVGISDAWQGIILNVAVFSCGAQLFALFLSNRRVKRIVTIGHSVNQLCFTLLYLLPIFSIPPAMKTALLLVFLFLGHILNNAINPSKINWLMQAVPDRQRGSFTAHKEMISLAGGMIVSISLGRIADTFRDAAGAPTPTYYRICCIALFLLTVLHTVTLLIAHEKEPLEEKAPRFQHQAHRIRDLPPRLPRNLRLGQCTCGNQRRKACKQFCSLRADVRHDAA